MFFIIYAYVRKKIITTSYFSVINVSTHKLIIWQAQNHETYFKREFKQGYVRIVVDDPADVI